ncbi:MAG: type III-B CRISPR-associated protein Cas10/Cmr2 [Mariniphaga sp.]
MNTYFALTIGPIYKTMAMARKLTRELWGASYLFSYLMEQIVKSPELKGELVIPSKSDDENSKAGLYPDHLILKLTEKGFGYAEARQVVEHEWSKIIKEITGDEAYGIQKDFFMDYFQLYSLEISLAEKEDPIKTILPLLDSMELKAAYVTEYKNDHLELFLNNINKWKKFRQVFGEHHRFPSVLEIAAQDLRYAKINYHKNNKNSSKVFDTIFNSTIRLKKENDEIFQVNQLKRLFNNPIKSILPTRPDEGFRFHHKYMAVVQADGDNLSQALHALYTMGNTMNKVPAVQEFSKFLMDFGKKATGCITDFGGTPIYMGGDDLLFFAPVKCKGKTLFHLIRDIDKLFESELKKTKTICSFLDDWRDSATNGNRRKEVKLSISYGISIAYHKFPLKESIETARKLLFEEAKMIKGKDSVSFNVLKHSGQNFGTNWKKTIKNGWIPSFDYFIKMLDNSVNDDKTENPGTDIKFLTSLQHKLEPLRPLLYRILKGRELNPEKVGFKEDFIKYLPNEGSRNVFAKHIIDNFFNEIGHKHKYRRFLEQSFEYLLHEYRELEDIYGNNTLTAQKAVDNLYATLRFIQFINQPDHNEEEN